MPPPKLTLHVDGRPRSLGANLWRVWMGPGEPGESHIFIGLDPAQPVRWSELDKLPQLKELQYSGTDAGIEAYVRGRPAITTLRLSKHGRSTIDLRGSAVRDLTVDLSGGALLLQVPPSLEELSVPGPSVTHLRVEGAPAGIELTTGGSPAGVVPGLERVRSLRVATPKALALPDLAGYRELEQLTLSSIGKLDGLAALTEFPRLRTVQLRECYGIVTRGLTGVVGGALAKVDIDGVRSTDAAVLKRWFAGVAAVTLRGVRTDAWLRANVDNPFRDWAEEFGDKLGKAVSAAWKKASTGLDRAVESQHKAPVREVLQAFAATLGKLSAKQHFDSTQREDADDAFEALIKRAGGLVEVEVARRWLVDADL